MADTQAATKSAEEGRDKGTKARMSSAAIAATLSEVQQKRPSAQRPPAVIIRRAMNSSISLRNIVSKVQDAGRQGLDFHSARFRGDKSLVLE